jgi:hypothetical protein
VDSSLLAVSYIAVDIALIDTNSFMAYLFLLEGSLTILTAIMAAIVLPKDLQRAYFLSQAKRDLGIARQLADSVDEVNAPFKWSDAICEFKYWHNYLIFFSFGIIIGTSSNFLSIIVQGMGYSTVKTKSSKLVSSGVWRCRF